MTYLILLVTTIFAAYLWQISADRSCEILIKKRISKKWDFGIKKNIVAVFAFFPMFLIYAFQYSLHSDYDNYFATFLEIKSGTGHIREIAIHYINKLVAIVGLDFQFVYIFVYLIAFIILAKCLIDYSKDYALSLALFITVFFTLGFLQIRQLVAVSIVLWGYRYAYKKKFTEQLNL